VCLFFAACGDTTGTGDGDGGDTGDTGDTTVDTSDTGDDTGTVDTGTDDSGEDVECGNTITAPEAGATCKVTPGSQDTIYLRGDVMTPTGRLLGGEVVVKRGSGAEGTIACVGCDCTEHSENATVIECPKALITPGLINPHDHIGWAMHPPVDHGEERYDHRHEWRKGKNGKTKLSTPGNWAKTNGEFWGEMRMVMGGATSMMGSGGKAGFTRNLDRANLLEGVAHNVPDAPTFPLGDTSGALTASGCDKYKLPDPGKRASKVAYIPHVAEGVVDAARNEFLCLAGEVAGSADLVMENSAFIHGIGVTSGDIGLMAADSTGLIWSPRSNVSLYGFTAEVGVYARQGVQIALGSDWAPSGSINLLRELQCADRMNSTHYDSFFSDRALVLMVTHTAAELAGFADVLGTLQQGRIADVTIFDAAENDGYRAVIDAGVEDVALVLRGGIALYGDTALVDALQANDACDEMDVCGRGKRICAKRETGATFAEISKDLEGDGSEAYKTYPLYFCDTPADQPTCVPSRPGEFEGWPTDDDADGDGISNATDNCPNWFNPPRPMDGGVQPDADADKVGDACDPCPFDPDTEACTSVDPTDLDGDGVPAIEDNCPGAANPQQENKDGDQYGDACDECPDHPGACPGTVYDIKKGVTPQGAEVSLPPMVVTALTTNGYWIQQPPDSEGWEGAEYSGTFVFDQDGAAVYKRGDLLEISGTVGEYFGQIQLASPKAKVLESGAAPDPVTIDDPASIATGGAQAAAYEGVLVRVADVTVLEVGPATPESAPTGEFSVTGNLLVDDLFYALTPEQGEVFDGIAGVLRFAWDNSKITPRDEQDIDLGPAKLAAFGPALVYLNEGETGPTNPPLTVTLTTEADSDFTVFLQSDVPTVAALVLTEVTIPAGEKSATVQLEGVAGSPNNVTITASTGDVTLTAEVRVIGADEVPEVSSLTPDSAQLSLGKTITLTVTTDLPAGVDGAEVLLTAEPAGLIELPASILVAAGETAAEVDVNALNTAGSVVITATTPDGIQTAQSTLEIIEGVPLGMALVEVYYDHAADEGNDDGKEWIKLKNGTNAPVDLSGWSLGWAGTDYTYGTYQLSGTLAPGDCFVVGGPLTDPSNGTPLLTDVTNLTPDLQNSGSPADGVALFNTPAAQISKTSVPHDTVIYGGENKSGLLDETGAPGESDVADAPKGQSILRVDGETWTVSETPNAVACPDL